MFCLLLIPFLSFCFFLFLFSFLFCFVSFHIVSFLLFVSFFLNFFYIFSIFSFLICGPSFFVIFFFLHLFFLFLFSYLSFLFFNFSFLTWSLLFVYNLCVSSLSGMSSFSLQFIVFKVLNGMSVKFLWAGSNYVRRLARSPFPFLAVNTLPPPPLWRFKAMARPL